MYLYLIAVDEQLERPIYNLKWTNERLRMRGEVSECVCVCVCGGGGGGGGGGGE